MYELDLETQQLLAAQRSKATNQYGQQKAQQEFNRANAGANYQQALSQMGRQWGQARAKLPGNHARRGLLNSGIYRQGLQDYATDRTNAYAEALRGYQNSLGQLQLEGRGTEQNLADAMQTIAAQEQLARAQIAAQLRGML
jgi:hypothetical protein